MIQLDRLPRDRNGIIQGIWRIVHESATYCGPVGMIDVVNGVGQQPVAGRQLAVVAALYGQHLYLEPWEGPIPDGFVTSPLTEATIDWWTPEPCPWRKAFDARSVPKAEPAPAPKPAPHHVEDVPQVTHSEPVDSFDVDTADADALREHCDEHGIDYDGRWGARRLRRAIRAASA